MRQRTCGSTCRTCGRGPLRTETEIKNGVPGVRHAAHGICGACHQRNLRRTRTRCPQPLSTADVARLRAAVGHTPGATP